jgi:hypothetical protein
MKPIKVFILAALFFSITFPVFSSSLAWYDFENNFNDSSGACNTATANGTLPCLTGVLRGITGSYCVGNMTDSNYVSIPPAVINAMGNTGTMKISYFMRQGTDAAGVKVLISSVCGVNGNFFLEWNAGLGFEGNFPSSAGGVYLYGSNSSWKWNRWQTLFIHWDTTGIRLDVLDNFSGTTINALAQEPLVSGVINFSGCTSSVLGRAANGDGASCSGIVDNVEYFNDNHGAIENRSYGDWMVFGSLGHSFVEAGNTTDKNGYRGGFYQSVTTNGANYYLTGYKTAGNILTPFHSAQSNWRIIDAQANLTAGLKYLETDFPFPSERFGYLLGPFEYADVNNSTPISNFKACYESVINTITAYMPGSPIFCIAEPHNSNGLDTSAFVEKVREVVDDMVALGKRVFLVDSEDIGVTFTGDNTHPDDATSPLWGDFIGNVVYANMQITPTPSPTPIPESRKPLGISRYSNSIFGWLSEIFGF